MENMVYIIFSIVLICPFTFQTQGWWCWVSNCPGHQSCSFPVTSLRMDHTEQEKREHKFKQKVQTVLKYAAFIPGNTDLFSLCRYCLWAAGLWPGPRKS